jgi:hypothetical protein
LSEYKPMFNPFSPHFPDYVLATAREELDEKIASIQREVLNLGLGDLCSTDDQFDQLEPAYKKALDETNWSAFYFP